MKKHFSEKSIKKIKKYLKNQNYSEKKINYTINLMDFMIEEVSKHDDNDKNKYKKIYSNIIKQDFKKK